jgi:galactose mutarotase-like enzyme
MTDAVAETTFRGEPAVRLAAGDLRATFLPQLGMTGVSLRCRGAEHLALPGGLDALRAGSTLGLPLLAPWANRLATRRYRAAGVSVDLSGLRLTTDDHGLPIHGLLLGKPGWRVRTSTLRRGAPRLAASIDVDAPAFPFPHRIDLSITIRDAALQVDTTIVPTGHRRVPAAFGWHPYLRLPVSPRARWRLRLPARTHWALDRAGIPTGASQRAAAER